MKEFVCNWEATATDTIAERFELLYLTLFDVFQYLGDIKCTITSKDIVDVFSCATIGWQPPSTYPPARFGCLTHHGVWQNPTMNIHIMGSDNVPRNRMFLFGKDSCAILRIDNFQ